jgi:hypothetical protein
MITPTSSTDPLVEALATRLRLIDLVGWRRIATWAERSELSRWGWATARRHAGLDREERGRLLNAFATAR